MSSDSEKLRCLKILREVERYVVEDKRDANEVTEFIQRFIIDQSTTPKNGDVVLAERKVLEKIMNDTVSGILKWNYSIDTYEGVEKLYTLTHPFLGPLLALGNSYLISFKQSKIIHFRCFGSGGYNFTLHDLEKKFFIMLLQDKRKELLKKLAD